MPAQERVRLHGRAAGRAAPAASRSAPLPQATVRRVVEHRAGRAAPSAGCAASTFSGSPRQCGERAGPRIERPHLPVDASRIARPVDPPVLARQLGGVGRARFRLRARAAGSRPARAGSAARRSPPARRAASAAVVVGVIGTASRSSIGPVSSPASICMMVMPVSVVAGQDRRLDRRRAAPARQQAGVDVEAASPRRVQHRLRQDQPVRRDHRRIETERGERRLRRRHRCAAAPACAPASPSRSAATCTGQGRTAWPRPAGRGGWQ